MDLTPPMTPPFSPPWGSPTYGPPVPLMAPLGPNGQMIGIVPPPHLVMERPQSADHAKIYEKPSESKKRSRPKTAEPRKANSGGSENEKPAGQPRYIKAVQHSSRGGGNKHKLFKSKTSSKDAPPPMIALTGQAHTSLYGKCSSPSPLFHLRYKSLTNLAQQVGNL